MSYFARGGEPTGEHFTPVQRSEFPPGYPQSAHDALTMALYQLGEAIAKHHINAETVYLDGVTFIETQPPPP